MTAAGLLAATGQTGGAAADRLFTTDDLRNLYAALIVLLVVRVALLAVDIWATVDLVRRPEAVLESAGVARGRWFVWFAIVPFAELYYVAVKRPELDAAAVRVGHREVIYDLSPWSATARRDLLRQLERRRVQHTVEDDELVVGKVDERRVDRLVAQLGPRSRPRR